MLTENTCIAISLSPGYACAIKESIPDGERFFLVVCSPEDFANLTFEEIQTLGLFMRVAREALTKVEQWKTEPAAVAIAWRRDRDYRKGRRMHNVD